MPLAHTSAGAAARVAAALAAGLVVLSGCSSSGPSAEHVTSPTSPGIGAWPAFLPSPSAGAIAHGSITDPAMSYAGSPVVVDAGSANLEVEVEGPSYPDDTTVGATKVDCTFDVTFSRATGSVTLGAARFDVLDHTGVVHPLKLATGTMPRTVAPGQTVTVHFVATLPSGEGLVRFYPAGSATVAGWDYVAETD